PCEQSDGAPGQPTRVREEEGSRAAIQENRDQAGQAEPDSRDQEQGMAGRIFRCEEGRDEDVHLLEKLRKGASRSDPPARGEDLRLKQISRFIVAPRYPAQGSPDKSD